MSSTTIVIIHQPAAATLNWDDTAKGEVLIPFLLFFLISKEKALLVLVLVLVGWHAHCSSWGAHNIFLLTEGQGELVMVSTTSTSTSIIILQPAGRMMLVVLVCCTSTSTTTSVSPWSSSCWRCWDAEEVVLVEEEWWDLPLLTSTTTSQYHHHQHLASSSPHSSTRSSITSTSTSTIGQWYCYCNEDPVAVQQQPWTETAMKNWYHSCSSSYSYPKHIIVGGLPPVPCLLLGWYY